MNIEEIALNYFEAVESRSHEAIMNLFSENCEVFFANFGVIKGRRKFERINKELVNHFKELYFKKDQFVLTVQGNRVVVEGIEYGDLASGQIINNNRMCNVFEINYEGLIERMYVYTDPNLGLKEGMK